jgi:hypothetical protein
MVSQQEGSFIIERSLVIKSTDIEKLCDFSTWAGPRLLWHGSVTGNILPRGYELQVSASLDAYTASTASPIARLRRTPQIRVGKHSP